MPIGRDVRRPPWVRDYGESVERQTERAALVALLLHRGSGWGSVTDDVERCGSALQVLERENDLEQPLLVPDPSSADSVTARLAEAAASLRAWAESGFELVTVLDDEYPAQLRTIHQRPPFLFTRGTLRAEDADGVAVVGTRKPTDRGLRQATEVATGLAERKVTVVSGLAAGIDAAAHRGALRAGGRTVGVIGTGLLHHYPRENADLQDQIARDHLVLSQFWPEAPPTKTSFPMRNGVMSGYAAATVVIEASHRSGARMQARLALEHGRPVLLMHTLLEHDWVRAYAERPGTQVVRNSTEVLDRLADILAPTGPLVWA